MALTKTEKRRLKEKYLIDILIKRNHPTAFRKYDDDLKEARRRLPYSFNLLYRAYSNTPIPKPTERIQNIANSGRDSFNYGTEKEKLAWNMVNSRYNSLAGDIAKRYDPRHIKRFVNERFFPFPEEIKYRENKKDLENISGIKEKLPKASIVLTI